MNTCERCGGEVSPGARFCRQCGAPVTSETEPALPLTRKYGHQVERRYPTPPEPEPPAWTYPGVGSSTSPFQGYNAQAPYAVPQPRGSSAKFWITVVLLACLLLMGVSSAAFWAAADRRSRRQQRAVEAQVEEQVRQRVKEMEANGEGLRAVPVIPPLPPAAPHPPTGNPFIDRLIYPDAKLLDQIIKGGNSSIRMITDDSLEEVREFYQQQLPESTITSKGNTVTFVKSEPGNKIVVTFSKPNDETPTTIQLITSGK